MLMMDEQDKKIEELRDKFFEKLEDEGPPDSKDFHPADISKVKTSNHWLKRFLTHTEYDVKEALRMLWDTCEWRRNFGTNDITEDNVRLDYLKDGVCFSHGKDKDGKTLFVIKSKLHTKNARDFSELQRVVVYWFERLEREGKGQQITLFFDMVDAGLANLDMELTRYLIGLFKNYYPHYLNLIIILEMPWILNAAFNIIKSWLPPRAIPKIKFVKKATLKEFVHPDDALKCWGGNNDYEFVFVSEVRQNGNDSKKVQFSEASPSSETFPSGCEEKHLNEKSLMSIDPDVIVFTRSGTELEGSITLKNNTESNLSYKIKTTALEKFKVRPSRGIVAGKQSINIHISLQPGYNSRGIAHNDRFLIMGIPVEKLKMTPQELAEFWMANGDKAEQHRLICRDGSENSEISKSSIVYYSNAGSTVECSVSSLFSRINQMEDRQVKLQGEFIMVKKMLLFFMFLLGLLLTWIIYLLNSEKSYQSVAIRHDEI